MAKLNMYYRKFVLKVLIILILIQLVIVSSLKIETGKSTIFKTYDTITIF